MAGSDPRFPYTKFREAILFAMQMANPNQSVEQPTFIWDDVNSFANADSMGRPFAWSSAPTTTVTHPPVKVDCVVEYVARVSREEITTIGEFTPSRAVVYVMADEYALIEGANKVLLGGATYLIKSVGYTISLFEFDMYPINCEAVDEA
jgi:hypothetical protein